MDFLTLVSAIVEDVERIDGFLAPLLETEDQIDPLMEVTGHVLALLEFQTTTTGHFKILRVELTFVQLRKRVFY